MYCRYSDLDSSRPTVLFIHGIGESGLCFLESFLDSRLAGFNIIVPDLVGFGKSSSAGDHDYSFQKQIARISELLSQLAVDDFHLVGHSMGGMIGTQFCNQQPERVLSFVNIEGDLTADNRFIVESAIQADIAGRFEDWLRDDFAGGLVTSICHQWPSTVRYLASLAMCQSKAFLASAYEIDKIIKPIPDSQTAIIGKMYLELNRPKVFCWGSDSLTEVAKKFLSGSNLSNICFADSFHWVMLDQSDQFYSFLSEYLSEQ